MQPNRPTSLTVIAVFHFVLGGLGLLCGMMAVGGQAIGGGGGNPFGQPPAGAWRSSRKCKTFRRRSPSAGQQEAPLQKPVGLVIMTVNLLLSILMIVAGVGLLQVKRYGWWGSVLYGAGSLLTQISALLFNLVYALPITQRILDQELQSHPTLAPLAGFMQMIGPITIGVVVLGMIYPTIVLIIMSRPKVRAAIDGKPAGADDYGDRFGPGGRIPDAGQYPPGYGQDPPGYGQEPDDRIGPAPQ